MPGLTGGLRADPCSPWGSPHPTGGSTQLPAAPVLPRFEYAYDVYMAQFLFEALRWLADIGVPVVLLSATLPPPLRRKLVRAYQQGATQEGDVEVTDILEPRGYPSTTAVCMAGGQRYAEVASGLSWRSSRPVAVEVLEEAPAFDPATVAGGAR